MHDEKKSRLAGILSTYDARTTGAARRAAEKDEEDNRFRASFDQFVEREIKAAIAEVSTQMKAAGHDVRVTDTPASKAGAGPTTERSIEVRFVPKAYINKAQTFAPNSCPTVAFHPNVQTRTLGFTFWKGMPGGGGSGGPGGPIDMTRDAVENCVLEVLSATFGKE